tara:strand:+ start:704 stop:1006 length:303 start_codon:yes stop_codon:yes gene_type:complete
MSEKDVIKICGNYPESFIKEDIASNPNFVFTNDPNFDSVNVYDTEGNTAIVNSFQECEHYVMGGWNKDLMGLQEINLQYSLVFLVMGILFAKFIIRKLRF